MENNRFFFVQDDDRFMIDVMDQLSFFIFESFIYVVVLDLVSIYLIFIVDSF